MNAISPKDRAKHFSRKKEYFFPSPTKLTDQQEREKQQKEAEKRMMREEKARLSKEICGK
jgi:hypothetical protein